jgi:hypothetical protein
MSASFADLGRILYEPGAVFARLKERSNAWLPLLTFLVLNALVLYWWVATADFAWQRQQQLAGTPTMTPDARAALEGFVAPTPMLLTTQATMLFGTLAAFAVHAGYFRLAGKALKADIGFGQWFGFVSWLSVPKLLLLPLMALQIALSDGRVTVDNLNLASLASLLHLGPSSPWLGLAAGLDFTTLWTVVLAAIGLRAWTGCSARAAAVTAVLPYAVLYGVWAAWIVLFS